MLTDVTLEEIIAVCGEPTNRRGHQYTFRCPICVKEGGDTTGDNLQFNEARGFLKCFVDDSHSKQILSLINKNKNKSENKKYVSPIVKEIKSEVPRKLFYVENEENLFLYIEETKHLLQRTPAALDYMLSRGITTETLSTLEIGYDDNINHFLTNSRIKSAITIPVIDFATDRIVGVKFRNFEYEGPKEFPSKDLPNCLAWVYGCKSAKKVVICEGFIDAMSFYQLLKPEQRGDFVILTPTNGVSSVYNCMDAIDFRRYQVLLLLDNDKAGDEVTQKISDDYPTIDYRGFLGGYNDVNDLLVNKRRTKCQ